MTLRAISSTFVNLLTFLSIATAACTAAPVDDGARSGSSAQTTDASAPTADSAVDGGEEQVCPQPGDVTLGDVVQSLKGPWKAPSAPRTDCTQADLDQVKALFQQNPGVKVAALKSAMSASCGSCVFTQNTDANWGTFVEFTDGIYENYGACYAHVTNADCAKNLAYLYVCLNGVCDEASCGSTQAARACSRSAAAGGCKTFTNAASTACGQGAFDAIDPKCGNIYQLMAVTCGGGVNHTLDTNP
jgi:hypothetical protein